MTFRALVFFWFIFLLAPCTRGQIQFQNLDFEAAQVPDVYPPYPEFYPIYQALPGWFGSFGTNAANYVFVNAVSLGSYSISIIGQHVVYPHSLAGTWSAVIQAGDGPNPPYVSQLPATIAQFGVVPAGAHSIQMLVSPLGPEDMDGFQVSLGGQIIPMQASGGGLFVGDISSMAGQLHELTITALPIPHDPNASLEIDNIVFSPEVVPQPRPCAFAAFVIGAGFIRSRQPRSQSVGERKAQALKSNTSS